MRRTSLVKSIAAANKFAGLLTLGLASNAFAVYDFEVGGWDAVWTSTASVGTSIRAQDRDKDLYSAQHAALTNIAPGNAPNVVDEGNINYDKGDRFTTQAKLITEVEFTSPDRDMGGLIRAKAWYDYTLNKENVKLGNQPNGYNGYDIGTDSLTTQKPLSDKGFDNELEFDGIALLDAYFYKNFYLGDNAGQVRVGKQVLNWGESLFFQGVNQINPIDVPAFRKPGAELKEVFIPVEIASISLDLANGDTIEAFYQWKWRETPIEAGCGNYWSVAVGNLSSHPNACGSAITLVPGGSAPIGIAAGAWYGTLSHAEPDDGGQFGVAYRWRPESFDAEIGFYGMNIHSRTPTLSLGFFDPIATAVAGETPEASAGPLGYNAIWEYVEDIQVYGISYAGNPMGWSVSAELNYTVDMPAQLDGNDLLLASLQGLGPLGPEAIALSQPVTSGPFTGLVGNGATFSNPAYFKGYDETNKTQFQVNALKVGNGLMGEDQYIFVAEVAFQHNDLDINNRAMGHRYNRGFIFGPGPNAGYDLGFGPETCGIVSTNVRGCSSTDGYTTNFSWAYAVRLQLQYNNVLMNGLTAYPSVYFKHDVSGYSVDNQMVEDRTALNLGLKFNYFKKYTLDLNYAMFGDNAEFDNLRDRDFYSVNFSVAF